MDGHRPENKSWKRQMDDMRRCSWYWGPISWRDSERLLMLCDPGTFLIRDSNHPNFFFTISFRVDGKTCHSRVPDNGVRAIANAKTYLPQENPTIVEIVEGMIKAANGDAFHVLIHRRGFEAEAERLHLRRPLSRVGMLPNLQYLCRLVLRQSFNCHSMAGLQIPIPLQRFVADPNFLVPDIEECCQALERQKSRLP